MKQYTLLLISALICSNTCSAEITKEINNFDNSTIITSVINTKDYNKDLPREIIFKKNNSKQSSYLISFVNRYITQNGYSPLEPVKMKIDNSLDNIQIFSTQLYRTAQRGQIAFLIDNTSIKKLEKSTTIQFQVPISTSYISHIKYSEFTLPKNILDEWKQVITME